MPQIQDFKKTNKNPIVPSKSSSDLSGWYWMRRALKRSNNVVPKSWLLATLPSLLRLPEVTTMVRYRLSRYVSFLSIMSSIVRVKSRSMHSSNVLDRHRYRYDRTSRNPSARMTVVLTASTTNANNTRMMHPQNWGEKRSGLPVLYWPVFPILS